MNKKDIEITNLTPYQVELLNTMWELDEMEDIVAWQDTLTDEDRKLSESLLQLVLIELLEKGIDKNSLAPIKKYLKRFML